MNRAHVAWFAVLVLAGAGEVGAYSIANMTVTRVSTRFLVSADITLDAPPQQLIALLTDFGSLSQLNASITESRVLPEEVGTIAPAGTLVFTRVYECFLGLCKNLDRVERVTVSDSGEIVAHTLPERSDVHFSESRWVIEAVEQGSRMRYELAVEPGFWVPPLVGTMAVKRILENQVTRTLEQLEFLSGKAGVRSVADTAVAAPVASGSGAP